MTHVPSTTHVSHPCLLPCDHTSSALTHASIAATSTCCRRHRLCDAFDDLLLVPVTHHECEPGPQDLRHTRASAAAACAMSAPCTLSRNAAAKPVNRKYASTEIRRSHMHQDIRRRINALWTVHTLGTHTHRTATAMPPPCVAATAPYVPSSLSLRALSAAPTCPQRRPTCHHRRLYGLSVPAGTHHSVTLVAWPPRQPPPPCRPRPHHHATMTPFHQHRRAPVAPMPHLRAQYVRAALSLRLPNANPCSP